MRALLVSEGRHEEGGALAALTRRTLNAPVDLDFCRISDPQVHVHRGKGRGFFKRAVAWMREARNRGYEALVLVIDEDGDRERIKLLDEAQQCQLVNVVRALGVAIRTFDAWMLADELALSRVLGDNVPRQSDPEANRNPKKSCTQLLAERGSPLSQTEFYAALAEVIEIAMLEDRCPKGFAPFAARLRKMALTVRG